MDKFQEMRVFVAVVDAGSFVGAAENLGISKAACSRYVSDLEQRLGTRLLHRTTRTLSLTQEGEVFLARCREILSRLEESEAEITAQIDSVQGILRISLPVSFGIRHLAPLWGEFLQAYPRLSLDISLSDRVVDLVEEGFDMAVRIGRLPDSTLVSRKLASTRLILCASPDYLAAHGGVEQPSDLVHHTVLSYSLLSTGDLWHFKGPQGSVSTRITPRVRSNNGDTCVAAAIAGQGVILQPSFLVADALASGQLVALMPGFESVELDIEAVYPTRRFLPAKVRALLSFLSTKLQDQKWLS